MVYFDQVLHIIDLIITAIANCAYSFLNSNFGIATTGSFFGAVGGYLAVFFTNRRAEILSRIGRMKIAIALTDGLFNLAYNLNSQHLFELNLRYMNSKKKFSALESGNIIDLEKEITYDLKAILIPKIDFELINSQLLRETGFMGRAYSLATVLIHSLRDLERFIEIRQSLIDKIDFRSAKNDFELDQKIRLFFGLRVSSPRGNYIDEQYSDIMEGIKISVESSIWFSRELVLQMIEEAKIEASKIYMFRPKIGSVDYSNVDQKYLPNDLNFKDWRKNFTRAK